MPEAGTVRAQEIQAAVTPRTVPACSNSPEKPGNMEDGVLLSEVLCSRLQSRSFLVEVGMFSDER